MDVFISYARADAEVVSELAAELRQLAGDVWLDVRLAGGQDWWDEILRRIRNCHVFVLALSESSLASEACSAEVDYAMRVRRDVVPVAVTAMELRGLTEPLRGLQAVRYERPLTVDGVRDLARSLVGLSRAPALPDPLPTAPHLPLSYVDRHMQTIMREELTASEQRHLLADLQPDLDNPARRQETLQLLRQFSDRPYLLYSVRKEIEKIASLDEEAHDELIRRFLAEAKWRHWFGSDVPSSVDEVMIERALEMPSGRDFVLAAAIFAKDSLLPMVAFTRTAVVLATQDGYHSSQYAHLTSESIDDFVRRVDEAVPSIAPYSRHLLMKLLTELGPTP